MPDQKIVVGTLTVNTGNSAADVNAVGKAVTDVKAKLADTGNVAKSVGKDIEGAGGNFSKLKDTLSDIPGATGSAADGVGKLGDSFKALLANPVALVIAAIVAALALLYKAFTNTFEGGEKMEQIFAGIKAVSQSLLDTLSNLGGAVAKLFSGDFAGAAKQAGDAIANVGNNAVKAFNQMASLTKQAQQLARESADNDLDQVKRQAQLAELRAQTYDDSVPIAKRKAALQDLQKLSEENAKEDLELAKKVADNKIAQLTVEQDGEKKNYVEIQQIKAEQLKGEVENANEQRAIGRQLTQINKQELAERKADEAKALEERKKQQENYNAYLTELQKIQQETASLGETDAVAKEKKQLDARLADQKRSFDVQFQQAKINADQYNTLLDALAEDGHAQRQALDKKFADADKKAETDFQTALAELQSKIKLDAVTNQYDKEKLQNQINYTKELADAQKQYGSDAARLAAYKAAIDEKLAADQLKIDIAQAKDRGKKLLAETLALNKTTLDDPTASLKIKMDALAADVKANKDALDKKDIDESEYNKNVAEFAAAREKIRKDELQNISSASSATADLLSSVSDAIGQNTAAGKALAIAAATIKALQTEINIIAGLSEVGPFGFVAGIAAAAATAVGLFATIKKIESVPVPGHSSSSVSVSSLGSAGSTSSPVAPTQQSTTLDQTTINGVGNAAANGVNGRAYVLSGDVANDRDRDQRLSRASRLGG